MLSERGQEPLQTGEGDLLQSRAIVITKWDNVITSGASITKWSN